MTNDKDDDEQTRLRSAALQNAQSILMARRRAEEALREQSEWLRVTLASIGDAVISTDAEGRVLFLNAVAETLTGWSLSKALGQPLAVVFRIVDERSREPVENPALRALREGTIVGLANHTILIARDGTERPIDDSAAPIRDPQGRLAGCVLIFRDVTERRLTERALERSEESLRDFFENAPVGLHWSGPDGIVLRVNRAELEMLGYEASEYVGHHIAEFHVDRAVIADLLDRLARGEMVRSVEARMRGKSGAIKHVLIDANALWEDGTFIHARFFTREVGDRKDAERVNAELAAIVESSDDAIIAKTLDGIIVSWNRAAERLFGYTPAEAIGRPVSMLAPPDRRAEMPRIIASLRAGERIEHFDTERMHKDGHRVFVSLSVSPVRDRSGHIIGAAKIARDVSERKRIEEERESLLAAERAARSEAERANRLKDEFLATLSHELRTPLNAILGWARLLRTRDPSSIDLGKGLEVIERSAYAQTQIIEDLLDLSRIMSGKVRLDIQRVQLAPLLEAALETIRPAAAAKDIRLQSVLDPSLGVVAADPNRLQQIVWNLLTNAVKFTPRGGWVEVSLQRSVAQVELVISDSGQGITPEFLPHVFERFRQGDASTTRLHGGLGIGLAIVKNLVELHGGTVAAKSAGEGHGSSFSVTLPIGAVHASAAGGRAPASIGVSPWSQFHAPSLAGLRVLVVDDEPDGRDLVRRVLEERGASVVIAESATVALKLFRSSAPDVLVSDIGMPNQDGYQFIQSVRKLEEQEKAKHVPALALTAFARPEDEARALVAGYQMHVSKPVEPADLVMSVAALAGRLT